jgi:hypothetical protein
MKHPRLGTLNWVEGYWEGVVPLLLFAVRGTKLRRAGDAPPGTVMIRLENPEESGLSLEQERAVWHLLDNEQTVLDAVWAELAPQFQGFDLNEEVICPEIEVSELHVGGIAYLGFQIDAAAHLEHGFCVVYHPTKGTFWGDWEALNAIEEADNLPRRDEETDD